jgi:hypothetical protein
MKTKQKQEKKIFAFIKAINKQYFDSFINEGEICLNTSKWFRDYEEQDDNIGDASEGAIASCAKDFTVRFADPILSYSSKEDLDEQFKNRDWSEPISGVSLNMFNGNNANILSLYAITLIKKNQKEFTHIVPKKFVDEFSNHRFVIILNPKKFISRVAKALVDLGKSPLGCIVKYYPFDNILRKNLTDFDKREKYSYQNEYRLLYHDVNPEMQIIKAGSLSDIVFEIDLYKHSYYGNFDDLKLTIEMDFKTENKNTTA